MRAQEAEGGSSAISAQYLARLVSAAVETLDASAFAADLLVVLEGGPRWTRKSWWRCGWMPRAGVVHARELDQLCTEHLAYRWLCGGVSVNYRRLSSLRVRRAAALEDLFVQLLGGCGRRT